MKNICYWNKSRRLYNLDFIKILATFGILFHHYQQFFNVVFSGINFYGGKFSFGFLVELFFMISGFLVAYTDKGKPMYSFISKKYLRFFPSVFLAGIAFLLIRTISFNTLGYDLDGRSYSMANIIASLFLFHTGWGFEFSYAVNNPVWYLCVLMLCYLIYYIAKHLFDKRTPIFFLFLVIIVTLFNYFNISFPFFRQANVRGYASFFIGVLLHEIYSSKWKKYLNVFAILGIFCYTVCSVLKTISLWYSLVGFLFPAIVIFAVTSEQLNHHMLALWGGYHLMSTYGTDAYLESYCYVVSI